MRKPPHLLATITANGFGHAVQTGAVLAELRRRVPDLRITVQSALPPARLAEVVPQPFDRVAADHDFGVVVRSAVELDLPATRAAYRHLIAHWDALADAQADRIRALGIDLVLSNVSFLAVEGAARAGVPAAALACLNWADILLGLFPEDGETAAVAARLQASYAKAAAYFQPAPSMPTGAAVPVIRTGPISGQGSDHRPALVERLNLGPEERLVVVALGGLGDAPPIADWPPDPTLRWLVPGTAAPGPRTHAFAELGLPWPDLIASADAFIGKPGYGSIANVAVHGTPFLFVRRGDWPEEPPLVDWLLTHTRSRPVAREALWSGRVRDDLEALWRQPARPRLAPTGAGETAERLLRLLPGEGAPPPPRQTSTRA